jgi:S-ribosylhomocysteine lyase
MINHEDYDDVVNMVEQTLKDVLDAKEVPACTELQCGWAASHSLEGAQELARNLLAKRNEWTEVFA